jgi:hypothetical protein
MKKSLILASLLLVGTSSIASDYIDLEYEVGATEYDNSNGIIDIDGYSASLKRNTENYILYVGILNGTAKSQKWIIDDSEYSLDMDMSGAYITGAFKIKLQKKIFFAPWLQYYRSTTKGSVTNINTEKKIALENDTDTDISTGVMFGYSLEDDVDSFAYVSYTLDDDLRESENYDNHALTFGINYAINTQFIFSSSYSKDLSNKEGISNSSSSSFSIGYIF